MKKLLLSTVFLVLLCACGSEKKSVFILDPEPAEEPDKDSDVEKKAVV